MNISMLYSMLMYIASVVDIMNILCLRLLLLYYDIIYTVYYVNNLFCKYIKKMNGNTYKLIIILQNTQKVLNLQDKIVNDLTYVAWICISVSYTLRIL